MTSRWLLRGNTIMHHWLHSNLHYLPPPTLDAAYSLAMPELLYPQDFGSSPLSTLVANSIRRTLVSS